jgi:hypothetical protein
MARRSDGGLAMIDCKHLYGVTRYRCAQMGHPLTLSSTMPMLTSHEGEAHQPKSSVRTTRIKGASMVWKNSGRRADQALRLKGVAAEGAAPDRSQTAKRQLELNLDFVRIE